MSQTWRRSVDVFPKDVLSSVSRKFESLGAKTTYVSVSIQIQAGSNMTGTVTGLFTHKSVPVIFEPPCSFRRCMGQNPMENWGVKYGWRKFHKLRDFCSRLDVILVMRWGWWNFGTCDSLRREENCIQWCENLDKKKKTVWKTYAWMGL